MSASNQMAGPSTPTSTDNFKAVFNAASTEYQSVTGKRLDTHPLATRLDTCDSPKAVSDLLRTQAQVLSTFRKGDDKLMVWLDPIVHILFTFSATLGEGIGLPFSPAKTIFTGIGVLLGAVRDVAASHATVMHLFERIHFFLQRLNRYTGIPLTADLTELLGKIMAQLLSILAFSTKTIMDRRIKKLLKSLAGRKEIEDAVLRLDTLTKEEILMVEARNLEVTHHVDENVEATKVLTVDIDDNVKAIKVLNKDVGDDVRETKALTEEIGDNVKVTKSLTEGIGDNIKATKALTEDVGNNVNVVDQNLKATKDVTDDIRRNQLQEKLRMWLSPPNPSINHNTAREIQHDGTAQWFIQGNIFREWKENGTLLWTRGNPGAGKSILCSAIIEDIKNTRDARSALIGYYYFDYKDSSKRDIRGLLASLLFQLSRVSHRCWETLYQLYKTCDYGADQPSNAGLAKCLENMLKLPEQLPIFIILDALDESPNNTETPSAREKVLKFVVNIVESGHSNLFICITSRPEQDIQSVLNPLTSSSRQVSLHEEVGQREDINRYLRSFVQTDDVMRRWKDEDKELVINTLSKRANGMFRWAFCQLDTLRRCMPSSIRRVLNELPTTLDQTYERSLQGIAKEKRQHAHRLFQCLVAASRPLRARELAEIFAIDFDHDAMCNLMEGWRPENPEEAVLSTCSTLISVIDHQDMDNDEDEGENGDGDENEDEDEDEDNGDDEDEDEDEVEVEDESSRIIQFSHFSVKEFLTSDRLQMSEVGNIRDHYIPLDSAHTILARACLAVLLQLDENANKKDPKMLPLVAYAAQHWVEHAKYEDVASRVQCSMEDLFNPKKRHLATWISIHNVVQEWDEQLSFFPRARPLWPPAALFYAAWCGFSGVVDYLVFTHAEDVNARYLDLGAPLHVASDRGHAEVVHLLLKRNADMNVGCPKYFGWTPLHFASHRGHVKVVQLLLEHGADANAQSTGNTPPLWFASENGHVEVVRLLLKHGADVDTRFSHPPYQKATADQRLEIERLVSERCGKGIGESGR